jgi:hypothetical protein
LMPVSTMVIKELLFSVMMHMHIPSVALKHAH